MELWIDNTGLQSAFECIEGRADPNTDHSTRELIQLATLIIFGNRVTLNGFADDQSAQKSADAIGCLKGFEIGDDIIGIANITEQQYGRACLTAAESVAPNLADSFDPTRNQVPGLEPPALPNEARIRLFDFVDLAGEPYGSPILAEVLDSALDEKAVGAVRHMMASSERLRTEVSSLMRTIPSWNEDHTYQLNILLRYHLNEALARQRASKYAPAVNRAGFIEKRTQYIIKELCAEADDVASELRGEPLGIPSVLSTLLQRSKGNPITLLKVARDLREHSEGLRSAIEKMANTYDEDDPETHSDVKQEIRELGVQLRKNVGLKRSAKLEDSVSMKVVFGDVSIPLSPRELLKLFRESRAKRRIAVLTEIVKASAYSDLSSTDFKKLVSKSSRIGR